jgi:hypothetical protein
MMEVTPSAGNVQVLAAPGGVPLWVSDVLPGSTRDLTAARELVLPEARPYHKDLPILADSGYEGAGAGMHVPVRSRPADPTGKGRNRWTNRWKAAVNASAGDASNNRDRSYTVSFNCAASPMGRVESSRQFSDPRPKASVFPVTCSP